MDKLKKMLFGSARLKAGLAEDVRAAVETWRSLPGPDFGLPHRLVRYAVVDIATSGLQVGQDKPLGLAGVALQPGGLVLPSDACVLDLGTATGEELDRRLAAFLRFVGTSPLVTYQAPFVGAFLERLFEERFGMAFRPDWIDLAWLLPDLFKERMDGLVTMDAWLESFGIDLPGRRDPLADSVALARLLQIALARAGERGAETPANLLDIGRARRWLRHSG